MKIKLITLTEFNNLMEIYKNFPALTLQNKGYEGINKDKLTELEKTKIQEIEKILSNNISGFRRFQNFKVSSSGKIQIRFQYKYDYDNSLVSSFTGVGYIEISELLNGFKN